MNIRFIAILLLVLALPAMGYSQNGHALQLNLPGQPNTIITGAVGGGTYSLPAGGGVLATSSGGVLVIPDIVDMMGGYGAGTNYKMNDLVSSTTPDVYFYSLIDNRMGNTPESSPASWQMVNIYQLNVIHKTLTLSAPGFTSLMSVHLTGTNTAGGRIQYMIRATDGGSQIATENGVIQWLATANSITCTVQATDKLHLGTVNSGCTPGFFNPLSQPGVSVFDNVTFGSPAPIVIHDVFFHIMPTPGLNGVGSPAKIRLEP